MKLKICVDTTILIDILKDENLEYQNLLYTALKKGEGLSIPVVVYAELMPQFLNDDDILDLFLRDHNIKIDSLDIESVKISALKWIDYLKSKSRLKCPDCGCLLKNKEHFLSDFYIGGYALSKCDALITRDRGIYKKYFKELKLYNG